MQADYIVVGAGSAGCVVARRLSDDPTVNVLLLEAGGPNRHPFISMPRGFFKMWGKPEYFWSYPVEETPGRAAETIRYGKGLGGSSAVNGMWYLRGMPSDFKAWAAEGNPGWDWDEIVRCYRDLEDYQAPGADPSRGRGGPLQVTLQPYRSPVVSAILAGGQEIGLPLLSDINQPDTDGIGITQSTVDRRGRRASSYTAFVKPVRGRRNLSVLHGVDVKRVLFEDGVARGVICDVNGVETTYRCGREVILSGGALQSPKLLQLSGVGPADLLARHGIPVVARSEHVGRNLCDHVSIATTFRLHGHPGLNREFQGYRMYLNGIRYYLGLKGLMAAAGVPVTALISTHGDRAWPNIQLGISPFSIRNTRGKKGDPGRAGVEDVPGLMFNGFDLRPKSRGTVQIISPDHHAAAKISIDWWDHPDDARTQLEIIRVIRQIARSNAMKPFVGAEVIPGDEAQSDEAILAELRWLVSPGLHANGTCKMGRDASSSVVDARLRVHGVQGLRVVDASIMPTPVSGNTNATAMVIGARAAELILADRSAPSGAR